jgi:DNA-binding response OmpR family regulator
VNRLLDGCRILVVEDQYLVAMQTADAIRGAGGEVVGPFGHLEPAHEALRRTTPDAAVLDIKLDSEQTYALARELVARGTVVVLLTGFGAESLPDDVRRLPRLVKPFRRDELVAALHGAIEAAGLRGIRGK